MLVNNEIASAFGAGWTLDGLQRIHVQPDALVLTDGAGAIKRFEPEAGGGLLFGPSATYGSGRGLALAVGDFDNDLDIDLAVPHHNNGRIYIFLNDGDGTFTEAAPVIQATSPDLRLPAVAVGDFDEDGNLDLVSNKTLQGEGYVFFGNGDGTFQDNVNFTDKPPVLFLLASPDVPGVADFDNLDGIDIVFTGGGDNKFLGDGTGGFAAGVNESGIGGQENLLVADVDDDGFADVVAAASPDAVIVTLNDGAGNFPVANRIFYTPISYGGGRGRWALAAADFDEDGFTDIVVVNDFNEVTILFGDGAGRFDGEPFLSVPTLAEPHSVVAADFDLDGHIDIATSESGGHRVEVLLNDADGDDVAGDFATSVAFDTETNNGLSGIVTADFNGDGRPDLAMGNSALAAPVTPVTVLLSQPAGGTFAGPAGDFSTITQNMDGSFTRLMKNGTTIEFDTAGLQTAVIDRNGNTTSYAYDVDDNLVTITDPVGLVTTFAYSGGLLTSVTDPGVARHRLRARRQRQPDPDHRPRPIGPPLRLRRAPPAGLADLQARLRHGLYVRLPRPQHPRRPPRRLLRASRTKPRRRPDRPGGGGWDGSEPGAVYAGRRG